MPGQRRGADERIGQLSSAVEQTGDSVLITDREGRIEYVNPAFEQISGFSFDEVRGKTPRVLKSGIHDQAFYERLWNTLLAGEIYRAVLVNRKKSGELFHEEKVISPLRNPQGEITHFVSTGRDITERIRAEQRLRESEERFRQLAEHIREVFWLKTVDGSRILYVNPAWEEIWGRSCQSLYAEPSSFLETVHPADRERVRAALPGQAAGEYDHEFRIVRPDGAIRWIWARAFPVRDERGEVYRIAGCSEDITERKTAEEALRESTEQLRQAQKMEAMGRLAGGIAHDFNNLLTVILGRAELLLARLGGEETLARDVTLMKKTAERAAALTRQLLAFSRQQMLQPKIIDLRAIVAETAAMLRPLIGEHIELHLEAAPHPCPVMADPGQLEQVLMNLALNARDAMPGGGQLTIETAAVELGEEYARRHLAIAPGPYVMLAVSDTGTGMDAETRARIFEPFFTTKEQGKGTGLGLATVYGIVKQSGGSIWVYSEPGHGTSFKVYLPRVPAGAKAAGADEPRPASGGGSETVLLVEDEEEVRTLAREILETAGYAVLEARDGRQATDLAERHSGPIHLLVSDVVMPGMSGADLVECLRPLHPELRLLFMSGYTDAALANHAALPPGAAFMEKPFTAATFTRTVREVLDRPRARPD
ncbi:MAG: hypothetical protein A2X52_04825 [Candidatus Rokubacteria bacterium GWC2_70_16]|nr:MAG: hypothetical protein A2X52_04825 [Candidatus Rokubacteria bacterium GWC2_70_16]